MCGCLMITSCYKLNDFLQLNASVLLNHDAAMISRSLVMTTRRHTCCQCCTMGVPLRDEKKSPNCSSPPPWAISWPELGWTMPDCFQQVCQLLFQSVLMRGGTGHCSNPKNGWTMTLRPLHCTAITTPITLNSMRKREKEI